MTADTITVEGNRIRITHPDKILWPEREITKAGYLQKLISLSAYLLPACQDRYLTVIRYPHGAGEESFYQKNAPESRPEFVRTAHYRDIEFIHLDSLSTLLWLGQLGALEFHPTFNQIGQLKTDSWVLDIDPSMEKDPRLMEAVSRIGGVLKSLGVQSIPKTSGGGGVHLVIPLDQEHSFEHLTHFGSFICQYVRDKWPKWFTLERRIKDRGTNIYLDFKQHAAGRSLAAAYSPRGTAGATVSTPITWDEVEQNVDPADYHLLMIEERIQKRGDLLLQVPPQSITHVLDEITYMK